MASQYNVSMLRVNGGNGEQAVAACVAGEGGVLGTGEEGAWLENCGPEPSIVLDCTCVVQLTDPRDVSAMAAWLSAAAVWLQVQQLEQEDT
jgi:hypothetical protein